MRKLAAVLQRWERNTISDRPRLEIVSALLLAPLLEEAIFRAAASWLASRCGVSRGAAALGSSAVFGLTHARFGRWFVAYAGMGGVALWATYARSGYGGAVALHAAANVVDLSLGLRRHLAGAGPRQAELGTRQKR